MATIASDTRFPPTVDYETDDDLLDAVRAVARHLPAASRATMTQAQFDAARSARGHASCPTAKQVAARLKMPWREVVGLALDVKARRASRLGWRTAGPRMRWTDEEIIEALTLVADRLGRRTLTIVQYAMERDRVLAEARRGYRNRRPIDLPSEHAILVVTKDWRRALRLAGLASSTDYKHFAGWPLKKALDWFVEQQGRRPTFTELDAYAKKYDVALARREHFDSDPPRTFDDLYLEVMAERGEEPLPLTKFLRDRSPWQPGSRPPDAPHRKRADWTRQEVVAALRRFLAERRPGGHPTTDEYYDWLSLGGDGPYYASLKKHGGWEQLVGAARKKPRAKRRTRKK